MGRGKDDHGIENEPALQGFVPPAELDESEAKAQLTLDKAAARDAKQAHLHSVHDELAILPGDHDNPILIDRDFHCSSCGYNLRGLRLGQPCPECAFVQYERPSPTDRAGYAQWLAGRIAATSISKTWAVTIAVVLLSGLWSVFGAFWNSGIGLGGFFAVAVWGPAVEEAMKIALIAVVIERAPYLFSSRAQIMIAAIGAGLMFAILENLLYLLVYVPDPPAWLVIWRWTVCVALHVGCTTIAGIGAAIVWQRTTRQLRRFPVPVDIRYLFAAILIHGLYNGTVTLMEIADIGF